MIQGHKFKDLEETGQALVAFFNSSQPEKLILAKDNNQALFDQHMETKKVLTQILNGKYQVYQTFIDLAVTVLCIFTATWRRCYLKGINNQPDYIHFASIKCPSL